MEVSGIHHVTLIVNDEERASWFYGEVLRLPEKRRPAFQFPGLFYRCGAQELHLIIAGRPLQQEDLFIRLDGTSDVSYKFVHRHLALVVPDFENLKRRLYESKVEVLLDSDRLDGARPDPFIANLIEGWLSMYGKPPLFCLDPFGNLLEIIPG